LSTAKAVGELGAVVGQDRVGLERETVEESGGGGGPTIGEDFEIDIAGGAVDRQPQPSLGQAMGRAFQRATVRGWMPSSRASAAREAVLCWI
jgi:hypothetical protein